MAIARGFNNVAFVFAGMARQEVSMLAEKRLQIRRQQFTEAGCRAADVGLHKYSSTKRIHRSYAPLVIYNISCLIIPSRSVSFSCAIITKLVKSLFRSPGASFAPPI